MASAMKTCVNQNCGRSIYRASQICPHCGTRQPVAQGPVTNVAGGGGVTPVGQPSKDKTTAALLAILLGGIGAHHFYLGNIGRGVIYLLFSWTFIPLIVGIIEGIGYLSTNDNHWRMMYPPMY